MSSSVEHELWQIFTFYTLRGDALDPEHLKTSQFLQLLRDCLIVEPRGGSEPGGDGSVLRQHAHLAGAGDSVLYEGDGAGAHDGEDGGAEDGGEVADVR